MRRILGRPWVLGPVLAGLAILAIVASAFARSGDNVALPTPIGDDFSFAELLAVPSGAPPSASPSATPVVSVGSVGSSAKKKSGGASAPAAASGPSGPVSCPSGQVVGELTDFSTSYAGETSRGETEWTVRAKGTVLNRTSRPVQNIDVEVTVHTDDAEADSGSDTVTGWVGTGSSANWTVVFDYKSPHEPKKKNSSLAVTGWSWGDEFKLCPTQGSTG
jgi:hypothetical protein